MAVDRKRGGIGGKLIEEIRGVLRAARLGDCPYGEPPEIVSSDGTDPDPTRGNWLINGTPRDVFKPACSWIVSTPDACATCELNPRNKPAHSARLRLLFRIKSWQQAGAVFLYRDLSPREWESLALLNKLQHEEWEKTRGV